MDRIEKTINRKPRSLQYHARAIHRVLGYLTVGLVIVFSLSGIILVHRTGDFMKRSERVEKIIESGLNVDRLAVALKMEKLDHAITDGNMIRFADGEYNMTTGEVSYISTEVAAPFNRFIELHKISDGKERAIAWFITLFGIVLFLLPVSALFMYKPGTAMFRRTMLYTAIGVVLAIVLLLAV